jgi:TonB family protein
MKRLGAICFGVAIALLSFVVVPAQEIPKEIKGGILNGKATYLPAPEYPAELKIAGVEGVVFVDVVIDESGTVISAKVSSSEALKNRPGKEFDEQQLPAAQARFDEAAQRAALEAKFSPTLLSGIPIRVSGSIIYNFLIGDADTSAVNGGIVNGKASSLPLPAYPEVAKAVRAGGNVVVRVTISENGDVTAASAISGHPLLRAAAVEAAKTAKFAPTMLSGQQVKVSGMLIYNFVPGKEQTN